MNSEPYKIPFKHKLGRFILRPSIRTLFRILGKVKLEGIENIPKISGYMIAYNHISIYEPPLILSFWPYPVEVIGAAEIWTKPGQSTLARMYGTIPVHRSRFDRRVMMSMINAINSGRPLLIAPEGGRSHTPGLKQGSAGIAYVIEKTGAQVLPVGVIGSTEDFFKNGISGKNPDIIMRIGKPFNLPDLEGRGKTRREARQNNTDLVMKAIASLLPKEYRGIYDDQPTPTTQT